MATSKKYSISIEQNGAHWIAKISRKVSYKSTIVTKQKDDFSNEKDAKVWAEETISELMNTQRKSNERHGSQRKSNEEVRRLRSARRAEKTEQTKLAKQAEEEAKAAEQETE